MVSYRQKLWITSRLSLPMPQVWVLTLDFMTGLRLRSTTMTTNKAVAFYRWVPEAKEFTKEGAGEMHAQHPVNLLPFFDSAVH
jgi:hypothetical protein